MYQDVLVPTDGSDGTRRAIAHALTIADRFDATVHALSIVPEGPLGTLEETDATARRAVDRVETMADREGVAVTSAIERGVPHEVILSYIQDNGIDMVVMGTQGRTGLDRVLVGSVAERVVRLADVPVVTVRLTDEIRLREPADAIDVARERARADGYEGLSVVEEPHRTSGSWIVRFETATDPVTVEADAVTAETRLVSTE